MASLRRPEPALLIPSLDSALTVVNRMDDDRIEAAVHMRGLPVYLPLGGDLS